MSLDGYIFHFYVLCYFYVLSLNYFDYFSVLSPDNSQVICKAQSSLVFLLWTSNIEQHGQKVTRPRFC